MDRSLSKIPDDSQEKNLLCEALRLIRVFHDLNQTELAGQLGISKSYLSEIESGKKQPRIELVKRYASEFEMPVSSILFFSENLEKRSDSFNVADDTRGVIANKVIDFLKLVEYRTDHVGKI